jgi:ACS family glucarate transporter-like MFS transporter
MESMSVAAIEVPTKVPRQIMLIPSIFMFWLVGLMDKFAFGTILADHAFQSEMGLVGHATVIGSLASVAVLTQAVGNGVFGWAVDRFGARNCATLGIVGWVISCALGAIAHSVLVLVVSRLLLGLCEGYTWPVGNALTVRWFPAGRRAKVRALWMSAVCIGPGISGFVTGGLLGSMSWRGVFWCLAGASLVLCLPMALFFVRDNLPGQAHGIEAAEEDTQTAASRASILRTTRFWIMTLAAAGTTIAVWALASWLPSYLEDYRHSSKHTFQYYVLGAYGLGLVTMLAFSYVADRLRRRSIVLSVALVVSGALLLIVGFVPSAPYFILIAATITIVYGVTLLIAQGFQDRGTAPHHVGTENGLMNAVSNVLAGLVPFAMGWLIDLDGGAYGYAFLLLFLLLGVSAVCAARMHRLGY